MARQRTSCRSFRRCQWTIWVILSHICAYVRVEANIVTFYHKDDLCQGQVLRHDLRYGSTRVRSKTECAAHCTTDTNCQSFLYNPTTNWCSRGSQSAMDDCSNMEPDAGTEHFDLKSACTNGERRTMGGACACPRGYFGVKCATPMQDCHHGYYTGGLRTHGVYWVLPAQAQQPIKVYCHMKGARPRTYILNRYEQSDVFSFNRNWTDYQDGFGDPAADFWLGLENLHVITQSVSYHLRFRIRHLKPERNLWQQYYNVRVASSDDLYRVTFDEDTAGNLGDSFSPSNGAQFSTPDNDNDGNENVNCAALHKAGWWFKGENCSLCNPTGPLLWPEKGKISKIPDEAFWIKDMGNRAPHKISMYLINF